MPLLESKRAPRRPSYSRALADQVAFLLTGSLIAVSLAVVSLVDLFEVFRLPGWVALVALLTVILLAQLRAGLRLRDQIQDLTGALYHHYPSTDRGIDVQKVTPGQVQLRIEEVRAGDLLVLLDGHAWRLSLDTAFRGQEDRYPSGHKGADFESIPGEQSAVNSFRVKVPDRPVPFVTFLRVEGKSTPAVVSIEWL